MIAPGPVCKRSLISTFHSTQHVTHVWLQAGLCQVAEICRKTTFQCTWATPKLVRLVSGHLRRRKVMARAKISSSCFVGISLTCCERCQIDLQTKIAVISLNDTPSSHLVRSSLRTCANFRSLHMPSVPESDRRNCTAFCPGTAIWPRKRSKYTKKLSKALAWLYRLAT